MNGYKTWVCNECAGDTTCYHTSIVEPYHCTIAAPYVKWRELEDEEMNEYKTWVCDACILDGTCYVTSRLEPYNCIVGTKLHKWRELEDKDVNYDVGQHMIKVLTNEGNID